MKSLRRLSPITLLPSGERTVVAALGKRHFTARGHMLGLMLADEGKTWRRGHGETVKESR